MKMIASIYRIITLGLLLYTNLFMVGTPSDQHIVNKTQNQLIKNMALVQSSFFIENQGQFHPDAQYLLRMDGANIWLTQEDIWLTFVDIPPLKNGRLAHQLNPDGDISRVSIRLSFEGTNSEPSLVPFELGITRVSYLKGADREDWQTDILTWGGVRYRDLYPGIDLVIKANESGPNWYFDIKEDGDPGVIRIKLEGAQNINQSTNFLQLSTPLGQINFPLFGLINHSKDYQKTRSDPYNLSPAIVVNEDGGYLIAAPFWDGDNKPNSIMAESDLVYSTYLGGGEWDSGFGISVDADGAAYVTGRTPSPDFPTTPGVYDVSVSGVDIFVAKLNPDGTGLEYATYIGGSGQDSAFDIAVEDDIAYVIGDTWSLDFPLVGEPVGENDVVVAALNATGTDLVYATLIGGSGQDYGNAITVDSGVAYITGSTLSNDFPAAGYKGFGDAYVVKLNSNGTFNDAVLIGGRAEDTGSGIDVVGSEVYIAGATWSVDFPAPGFGGNGDLFVAKYNSSLTQVFAQLVGGIGEDRGFDIEVNNAGEGYVTGFTKSPTLPDSIGSLSGTQDALLVTFDSDGDLLNTYYLGGTGSDEGRGIGLDTIGNVYLGGNTESTDFPVTNDAYQPDMAGGTDAFATHIDLGEVDIIQYATYLGGTSSDTTYSLAIDKHTYAYLTGSTNSNNYPTTIGAYCTVISGTQDAFVSKIGVGIVPRLTIEKETNHFDADDAPGPSILTDTSVNWTYTVTNTGRITITDVAVTDSEGVTLECPPQTTLAVGETITCTASGIAVSGQYTNTGQVTGTPIGELSAPVDTDPSHYFGAAPGITVTKTTNGLDGSAILVGEQVTWTYTVTNTGNVPVHEVALSDDQPGIIPAYQDGDLNEDQALDLDETWVYTATSTAMIGETNNTILATGVYTDDFDNTAYPQAEDSSSYFGASPGILIQKTTNGSENPYVLVGNPITWTYTVTNTGNVPVEGITVSDSDPSVTPGYINGDTNTNSQLDLDETWVYSATGTAVPGGYSNTGTANGTYTDNHGNEASLENDDASAYFGAEPSVLIQKFTNGLDADSPPGPIVAVGDPITWTFTVTSTGNVTLTEVTIEDDLLGGLVCTISSIPPGGPPGNCQVSGTALPDKQINTATVTATVPVGPAVTDTDSSHYFGAEPGMALLKRTNGENAPTIPGPYILVSDTVEWTYLVTNTGNITLTNISVLDDIEGPIDCQSDSLGPDESTQCLKTGEASAGQYVNTATATGVPPVGQVVTDTYSSHYFGIEPGIRLDKRTNGQDTENPPGPYILVGDTVTWTFTVTNTGNVTLTGVTIEDDLLGGEVCTVVSIAPGDPPATCTVQGTSESGQHTNTATVTAQPPAGPPIQVEDTSHYFGAETSIDLEKHTNGQDADIEPGPDVLVGDTVTWTYSITNTGNVTLTQITVEDDREGSIACAQTTLAPNEGTSCEATAGAIAGTYTNNATASGKPPGELPVVSDDDPSHYFGVGPGIQVLKLTNGLEAKSTPGPYILVGDTVTWTFVISNTGNATLTDVILSDDFLGEVECPTTVLADGEGTTCTVTGTATLGQHTNTATVTGTPPVGDDVSANDTSHYFGAETGIVIQKFTNGIDADSPPGPLVAAGSPITWTFTVTNTGNVTLTDITIEDDLLGGVVCTISSIAPGGPPGNCQVSGTAQPDQQINTATVTATPPVGPVVTDTDSSHYFGAEPGIALLKLTNGENAPTIPGPYILVSDTIEWTYLVTNTGNITLTAITVLDDTEGLIECQRTSLAADEATLCSKTSEAFEGQYSNSATATGIPPVGQVVTATNSSHYYGVSPGISLLKRTNGQDADSPPGPYILVGESVTWTYVITNSGNITLTNVTVTDDNGTPAFLEDDFTSCSGVTIDAKGSYVCTTTEITQIVGQYTNTAIVRGTPLLGDEITATDTSHFFGVTGGIEIEKSTNGHDADTPTGPIILSGYTITWTYTVTNTSNIDLIDIHVTDSDSTLQVDCPSDILSLAEPTMTCTAENRDAEAGQYTNLGTATGKSPDSRMQLSDSDPSHYFGADPQVDIEVLTNGFDADTPPGQTIMEGDPVYWSYFVANTGNVGLAVITVTDDHLGGITCPKTTLNPSELMGCLVIGTAAEGLYSNQGEVQATYLLFTIDVTDSDPSHYTGVPRYKLYYPLVFRYTGVPRYKLYYPLIFR